MPPTIKKLFYSDSGTLVVSSRTFQYSFFFRLGWNKVYDGHGQIHNDLHAIRRFRAQLRKRTEDAQSEDAAGRIWQQHLADLFQKVNECTEELEELEVELYLLEWPELPADAMLVGIDCGHLMAVVVPKP